jgi:hypothetical protein
VIFNFNNFTVGDSFHFNADVDHPNPALTPLNNCSGKTGLALLTCLGLNAGITTANNAALLAAETVLANQIAGATVTFKFGGPGFNPTSTTGSFQSLTLLDLLNGNTANTANTNVEVVPEPGSFLVFGLGLALVYSFVRIARTIAI